MTFDLVQEVLDLKQGEHLCLVYDKEPAEQMPALLPFIKQGLENNERCIYIADDFTIDEFADALNNFGIDVERAQATGALCLWTKGEWRQPGELDSTLKAAQVQGFIDDALAAGFKGVRFGVEMTWTLGPDIEVERLRHWEATINTIFSQDVPGRIICQYNRSRLSPAVISAALSTHPVAILGGEVCTNPYYEAPVVLGGGSDAERVDWMLAQLRLTGEAEREREERVRAEIALREAEASQQRMEDLFRLAEETADQLRKANQAKDEFLALVSHELRTPVTTILGNAAVLRSRSYVMDEETRDAALTDLYEDAKRLSSLIGNLLLLTRIEAGSEIDREPVMMARLVEQMAEEHRHYNPHRSVNVRGAPSAIAYAHSGYVEDVVRNLLSNAEKYSPLDQPIDIEVTVNDNDVTIGVLDRGVGLEQDELDSLFRAFYRSPRVSHTVRGMGIGLAVCRRLLEVQGGRIWAEPRDSGGSAFRFALPLVEDSSNSTS